MSSSHWASITKNLPFDLSFVDIGSEFKFFSSGDVIDGMFFVSKACNGVCVRPISVEFE